MSWLAEHIHWLVERLVALGDGWSAAASLTLMSVVTGALMLWIVGLTTPQKRLERARSQLAAAVYEMRLYIDSPRRIFAAQGRLFGWFLAYMALLLPAFIVLTIPLGVFLLHLETRHGLAPLVVAQPVVVRIDLADVAGLDGYAVNAAPATERDAVRVTAPALYLEAERRVYVRVQIDAPGEHRLAIDTGLGRVDKILSADSSAPSVYPQRHSGIASFWQIGAEPPLDPDSGVAAISVTQPDKPQDWLGFGLPWWAYWLLISTVVALLLRRPMGVVL